MEFLLSPSNAQSKTILALLISNNEATDLLVYSWEENAPLRSAKLKGCGYDRLEYGDRMPLLMIPSNHNASFTLVTESGLTVYDDVLSPEIRRIRIDVPQIFPPNFVGSCRSPLWVQWAKPCRHPEYLKTNDDFFLVREDGELDYFEIVHNKPSKVQSRTGIASLNFNVDSAFAILESFLHQGGDICVVGGDMNDGAVCHLMARVPLNRIQTISNLAPLRDMLILDTTSPEESSKRVFVCSGQGEGHAAVTEIRRGLDAKVGFVVEQEDSSMATGVWILPELIWDHLTVLVSYPLQTSVLRISYLKREIEIADDDLANQGLQLNSQTLAVAVIDENVLVQITASAITILSPLSKMSSVDRKHANRPISIASINRDDRIIATVAKADDGFEVLLSSIVVDDAIYSISDFPKSYSMLEEPSSIIMLRAGGRQLLIIGTIVGSIHVLAIEAGQRVGLLSLYSTETLFPNVEVSAICSLAFLTDSALKLPALACGTRNGWLLGITIASNLPEAKIEETESTEILREESSHVPDILIVRPESAQRIGQTSVQLFSETEDRSAALVLCDSEVHRLAYLHPDWSVTFQVSRVWFTDVLQVCLLE
jgi:Mono-functional DNA-alkylating methyl methanesulfonate N-term